MEFHLLLARDNDLNRRTPGSHFRETKDAVNLLDVRRPEIFTLEFSYGNIFIFYKAIVRRPNMTP